jgi:hypothetical protein
MKKRLLFILSLFISVTIFAQQTEIYKPELQGSSRTYQIQLSLRKATAPVQVEVKDNFVILEGDIILGRLVDFEGQGAVTIDGANFRWPNGIIPYTIAPNHPQKADILNAIKMINENTVLCVKPRTNEADFVNFVSGSGCASFVGKRGGQQDITIGSCSVGSIAHEMIHAAGLYHEQSREDRDNFIKVNFANITAGKEHNFDKHISDATDVGPYNYGSIMHYGATAFSKNGNKTIEIKIPPGTAATVIGQRTTISAGDQNALKVLYPNATGCSCNVVSEDCIPMNYLNVVAKKINNRWKVVDGNSWLFDTDQSQAEADMIVKIIKQYKINQSCYVARPNPPFSYLKVNNQSPTGAVVGEDCISFNPANLTVKLVNGNWTITDGNSLLFNFGAKQAEAIKAVCIIKKYGFTKTCYVGRPGPSLQYLRK